MAQDPSISLEIWYFGSYVYVSKLALVFVNGPNVTFVGIGEEGLTTTQTKIGPSVKCHGLALNFLQNKSTWLMLEQKFRHHQSVFVAGQHKKKHALYVLNYPSNSCILHVTNVDYIFVLLNDRINL